MLISIILEQSEATFGEISATPASDVKTAGDRETNATPCFCMRAAAVHSALTALPLATLPLRLISIDTGLLNENTTNLVCWEPLFESIFSFVLFLFAARPHWTFHKHGTDTPITAFYEYRQA
jgi:hypothetical protein